MYCMEYIFTGIVHVSLFGKAQERKFCRIIASVYSITHNAMKTNGTKMSCDTKRKTKFIFFRVHVMCLHYICYTPRDFIYEIKTTLRKKQETYTHYF